MTTFSQHLFRALLPGFLLVLFASGIMIKELMGRSLTSEFDQALASRAQALMAVTEQDEDGVELDVYPDALSSYFLETDPDYFEIRNSEGQRLFSSASLPAHQSLEFADPPLGDDRGDKLSDVVLPNGRPGRQVQRTYFPKIDIDDDGDDNNPAETRQSVEQEAASVFAPSGAPVEKNGILVFPEQLQLTVATSRKALDAHLTQLNVILLLTGLLTTSAVVLLQRGAIRRAVRPIKDISEQIRTLDINQIDRSLTLSRPIEELDVLTTQFNRLMQDLHKGFQRERRFSADLAHEMRTPLAELRSLVEVYQRWPSDTTLKASFNDDLIASVERMERLTQNLLALSRGDLGLLHTTGTIDLSLLIPRLVKAYAEAFESRQISVSLSLPPHGVPVVGQDHWAGILENLFDNIAEYSPSKALVTICLSVNDATKRMILTMENPAPELTDHDVAQLFDRLWRKEQARSSSRHSGLGLSLVRMYATGVGADVYAEHVGGDRLRIVITGLLAQSNDADVSVNHQTHASTPV